MIVLESVTKLYGLVIGVNDITASLQGGAYGLLGPNGSGKTTLLNLLTGQLRPTLGRVRVLDQNPFNNAGLYRQLGICPAVEALYLNVSGYEWVRYMMELHGFNRKEAGRRAEAALAQVGMGGAMHRYMGQYSRGMRQRTKVAQAIAHDPQLLILDEPFNGLDPVGRHELTEMLRAWVRGGKSLILASHVLHEVEAITQSFLLISNGRVLATGSSDEVQDLLADVPNEIRIRSDRAASLAGRLLEEDVVDSIRFEDDRCVLVISTRSPAAVYSQLPRWTAEAGCQISEIRSANESLDTLFGALMRIHRGEVA
jgi:ABC-2 type transport system ATP-binding protein